MKKKSRKWIVMLISALIFGLLSFYMIPAIRSNYYAAYDRKGIETICKDKFGDVKLTDALADEIFIVSFEFNTHTPFTFSKYNARLYPQYYDVSIANATESSAAAPTYFDPKVIGDLVLIDGGVIANDPALLAYMHATYHLK